MASAEVLYDVVCFACAMQELFIEDEVEVVFFEKALHEFVGMEVLGET